MGYCGLFCGDCFFFRGRIAELSKELRRELRRAKLTRNYKEFVKFSRSFENFPECYELLGVMVRMRCKGCREGGGPPFCRIRRCAGRKNVMGCWECDDFENCDKLKFLEPTHGNAHIKNLRKIRREGVEAFLQGRRYW